MDLEGKETGEKRLVQRLVPNPGPFYVSKGIDRNGQISCFKETERHSV